MEPQSESVGLTTQEALQKLYNEIDNVLSQFEHSQKIRKTRSWMRDAIHHSSQYTTINWISATLLLLTGICFIATYCFHASIALVLEGTFILLMLVLNVSLELYDNKLRHNEVPNQVRSVLSKIKAKMHDTKWMSENYPTLYSPFSPCITLQWTYRDNKLVNLPWSLLVKGDVILIRPGQISPGYCEAIEKSNEYQLLHSKEVYGPTLQNANEVFSVPKTRKPLQNKKYRLLDTPYLSNLHVALEQAIDRPVSQHNQQRFLVMTRLVERNILPVVFLMVCFVNAIKYFCLFHVLGTYPFWDLFVLIPLKSILPLLPLVFPMIWNILNYLGMARHKTSFERTTKLHIKENPLEEDPDGSPFDTQPIKYTLKDVWPKFVDVLKGRSVCRSANIVHVLGSVSALCCVDKKGILSWPNPAAEKVFFLRNSDNLSVNSSLGNIGDINTDHESLEENDQNITIAGDSPAMTVAEVLDLTHLHNNPFKVHFDDVKWNEHITSLKPLGLAIILNTCNLDTQEHYTQFCSHISCEAMYNESLVPVTNRRCLCSLATEIGFSDQAQKVFSLEQQLCTYRHLQPEMVRRDNKYARSLQLSTKLKFPFPHMFATVVKELSSGSLQLLSEGTADIILDSCVEFWDGNDLCPLSVTDRKRIQDFYQRSSLTSYCTAFAYRPLNRTISNKLSDVYLELPSDSRHLYTNHRSPTPLRWDCQNVLEPKLKGSLTHFYSTDSLLCCDGPFPDVNDAESCFDMQCNQIFIGMVSMQYQPLSDMVQLIEQLERACIRFVHFSKENELRSRVFSEKMGLESGWNCHISLLSERTRPESDVKDRRATNTSSGTKGMPRRRLVSSGSPPYQRCLQSDSHLESSRTMSFSAPCAINMEQPTVKFEPEQEHLMKQCREEEQQKNASQDSLQLHTVDLATGAHDFQSLSCLTDSTEHSAPVNFDMSNRAKLPRGIDKIRPHIELIDNVPLLVSLFTDCTAVLTKEMLHIMQEYGEVVCVMGSAANCENIGIFMQADASIAVEPLYPQVCQKDPVYKPIEDEDSISPIDLARMLNSVACSLSVKREEPISMYHLIMEARHYILCLWNTVQFWLCSSLTLSFMQCLAAVFMLPALLTAGQVLWFVCIVIPLLSVSLMGVKVDKSIMQKPLGKNQTVFSQEVLMFVLWCYGLKFLPLIFTVLISFFGTLSSHCVDLCRLQNCTCNFHYSPVEDAIGGWMENSYSLLMARHIVVVIITMHLIVISVGFVYRESYIWKKSPHSNYLWLASVITLLFLQTLYTVFSLKEIDNDYHMAVKYEIPLWILIFVALSPVATFVVNELIKWKEIESNLRFQRRSRLDFGTKLGMNSPF